MIGTLAQIRRYPVKSMGGEGVARAAVTPIGLAGDRHYSLFEPTERRVGSAKQFAVFPDLLEFRAAYAIEPSEAHAPSPITITFPDGSSVRSDDPACCDRLSAWFSRAVGLGRISDSPAERPAPGRYALAGTFLDYAAVHLVTDRSMASLARGTPGSIIATDRFRPNLVVASTSDLEYPENEWTGRHLRIGDEVVIKITDPCPRCVMTTMPQRELVRDPEVLKSIARHNTQFAPVMDSLQPCLGAYAFVVQGGEVAEGDAIRIE